MDYEASECKLDVPAMLREGILTDVNCRGEAERCPTQMSSAFAGWAYSQIDEWCQSGETMLIDSLDVGAYFAIYHPDDTLRGYYRLFSIHVAGKTVSYRNAKWYEWLWCHFVLQCRRSFPRFQYNPSRADI